MRARDAPARSRDSPKTSSIDDRSSGYRSLAGCELHFDGVTVEESVILCSSGAGSSARHLSEQLFGAAASPADPKLVAHGPRASILLSGILEQRWARPHLGAETPFRDVDGLQVLVDEKEAPSEALGSYSGGTTTPEEVRY